MLVQYGRDSSHLLSSTVVCLNIFPSKCSHFKLLTTILNISFQVWFTVQPFGRPLFISLRPYSGPWPRPLTAEQKCISQTDVLLVTVFWPGWLFLTTSPLQLHTLNCKEGPSAVSPSRPKTHTWIETGQEPASSTGKHTHTCSHIYSSCTYTCTQSKTFALVQI